METTQASVAEARAHSPRHAHTQPSGNETPTRAATRVVPGDVTLRPRSPSQTADGQVPKDATPGDPALVGFRLAGTGQPGQGRGADRDRVRVWGDGKGLEAGGGEGRATVKTCFTLLN